jgi:hypothetical protein
MQSHACLHDGSNIIDLVVLTIGERMRMKAKAGLLLRMVNARRENDRPVSRS